MLSNEPAIRDDGAHVVVMLRGELDIANAADLGVVLSEAVARNPHVIADLSDLTFIDCASVGVLVRARTRAREAGGDLVLAGGAGGRCGGSSPCRAWLACSLSMPAWTRRRGSDLTCTFRSFGTGWLSRLESGLLDLGRSGRAAAHEACCARRYLPLVGRGRRGRAGPGGGRNGTCPSASSQVPCIRRRCRARRQGGQRGKGWPGVVSTAAAPSAVPAVRPRRTSSASGWPEAFTAAARSAAR